MHPRPAISGLRLCHLVLLLLAGLSLACAAEPLRVCATVPDLGDLARSVGGDQVEVTVFARGGDDPHFIDARPSFAKALSRADLLVLVGLELEIGWLPTVCSQSRNGRIAAGSAGWCDASSAIVALGRPSGPVDRSAGDVHGGGNPHYLTDPVCGVQVARLLAERLATLAPERREGFTARYRAVAGAIGRALVGDELAARLGEAALLAALEGDTINALAGDRPGGWLGLMRPHRGAAVFADHDLWPYLARRYGFTVAGFLEPKPGVPPTTRHLAGLVELARTRTMAGIITVPYFEARHAAFLAEHTRLPVIRLAHQVGAADDAGSYLAMLAHNVQALAAGLGAAP